MVVLRKYGAAAPPSSEVQDPVAIGDSGFKMQSGKIEGGSGDITSADAGTKINVYAPAHNMAAHAAEYEGDQVEINSAEYGKVVATATVVDVDNIKLAIAHTQDESNVPWAFRPYVDILYDSTKVARHFSNGDFQPAPDRSSPIWTMEPTVTGDDIVMRTSDRSTLADCLWRYLHCYYLQASLFVNATVYKQYAAGNDVVFRNDNAGYGFSYEDSTNTEVAKVEDTGATEHRADMAYGGGIIQDAEPLQVTDSVETDIATISLAQNEVVTVEAWCTARKTDGTKFAHWHLEGTFYRNTGNVTLFDSITHLLSEASNPVAWSFNFVADTGNNTIDIRAKGENATNFKVSFKWKKVT